MPWLPRWRARNATAAPPVEARSVSIADPMLAMMLGYSAPGIPHVSETTALTLSAVYRAVSLISGSIASLPLRTLAAGPDGTQVRAKSFLDDPGLDRWTPFEWKELVVRYLLLHGAAPLQHIFGGGGQLVGLAPVHPLAVEVEASDAAPGGREFTVRTGNEVSRKFDARTMTYLMGPSLDGIRGISPITAARISLGTGISGEKAAHRMFTNGAMIAGLVTPKDDDLDENEARVVKDTVNRAMTGPENVGDIAVVNRRLEFTPWTMSATDAQFIQSREFSIDEVGRWYGVPAHLLGRQEKSTSWGQGITEQNRGLHRYTLSPWTGRVEDRLSRLITTSKIVEFDYADFLSSSPDDEIKLLLDQVNGGLLTPNEARRVRNLAPLEGAENDRLRLPAGMVAVAPGSVPTPGSAA